MAVEQGGNFPQKIAAGAGFSRLYERVFIEEKTR